MNKTDINSEITHGNFGLERVLRNMVGELQGKYPGNIYYACQSDRSFYADFYSTYYKKYEDDSVSIHNTIQAAVDAATQYRGDIVIVMPDKWQENVYVDNQEGLKLFGVGNGYGIQWRSSDGATKLPFTPYGGTAVGGVCLAILSRDVEIANMMFDPDGGHACLYVGDGDLLTTGGGLTAITNQNSASCKVHNCQFGAGGSSSYYGVVLEGCGDGFEVRDSLFEGLLYAGVYVGGYSSRSNQNPVILNNRFLAGASGYGVDVKNIAGGNINTLIQENSFRDGKGRAFTYAVRSATTDGITSTIKNAFACANKISMTAADFCSGDTFVSAGNAPHFLQDSTDSA